ncbi:hypothetical protein IW262DRAFT_1507267 [Armillaria fumosa]|nr:hypothetical protein IW262DRAFT_1507267 [Armillaria fumosa]
MAYSVPAYTFELKFNGLVTGAGTPSTNASTPVSSYPSSPASSPSASKSDKAHIPRPSNAYIIFRSEYVAIHKSLLKTQQKASKKAGAAWHELPKESQDYYRELAKQRKEEHARTYPGYKYQPRRSKRGKKLNGRKKTDAPVAPISMDVQSFYLPPPTLIPSVPEVLQPQPDHVLSSIDLSHRLLMANGNGNGSESFTGFPTIQAPRPAHPPPSASLSSIHPDEPQIERYGAFSIDNLDENEDLNKLMKTYSLDSSYLDMICDQPSGSLYNEWGSILDPGYPATPINYSPLLSSSMASDAMDPVFPNSFEPY